MKRLGKRLVAAREMANCPTTAKGARKAKLPFSTLRDYELGKRDPGAVRLAQICRAFGCSSDWLLGL